jgi:phosphoglycerol transferase MdoB-like AlkP superfamily enzyme
VRDVAVDSKDTVPQLFTTPHPNVIMVIMESFMSKTMASLGGLPNVAIHLDELGTSGILFTNMYANSFRTDRGVVSILSGYPGQPTTSIMKYPKKTQSLPSIPRSLKNAGYDVAYYYGGDINFTNTRAYLVSMGIEKIVSDKDFPLSQRLSKWGVYDHIVFDRALGEIKSGQYREPFLRVIQTSSSHEPFDVPFKRLKDPYLNSVAYTDSSIGQFINHLKTTTAWKNTVVILVPDHAAHYPQQIKDDSPDRYKIPLIITGGAVRQPMKVNVFASQIDIAATLLYQLGIPSKEFTFSKNILNPSSPHFGFFTFPNLFGFITSDSQTVFNCDGNRAVLLNGKNAPQNMDKGKAFLQKLYDDLGSR